MKVKLNVVLELDEGMVDAICDDMDKFGESIIIINKHECVVYDVLRRWVLPNSEFPSVVLDAMEKEPLVTHSF